MIHSEGKSSELYLSKVGTKARTFSANEKLKIDLKYFQDSISNITNFITDIKTAIPSKYTDSNKSYIFKQMWEATCLNSRVKFDKAWVIVAPNLVRPIDIDDEFGFSSSEIEIYNLFRHMYNDTFKVDFAFLFQRWKPQSNENQIATSWLDNQFYF